METEPVKKRDKKVAVKKAKKPKKGIEFIEHSSDDSTDKKTPAT